MSYFLERNSLHKEERKDGIELVMQNKNLFILGKPGAGKTTFLKHIAIKGANNELPRDTVKPIPVYIGLKAHTDAGRSLFEAVKRELHVCQFPEVDRFVEIFLNSGQALILLDGLDEVSVEAEKRNNLIQEIEEFIRLYRDAQFILTCRVAAANFSFDAVDFQYLEMADFSSEQVKTYIHNWFEDEQVAESCWQDLQKDEYKGLQELSQTPLLLGLLCLTYQQTLEFPLRRVEIYEEAIDVLLRDWSTRRRIKRYEPYQALSKDRKKQMLTRIAKESFDNSEFLMQSGNLSTKIEAFMSKVPQVEEEVDGELVLQQIDENHGILVQRAQGHKGQSLYSYAHLSFQEYFTAKWFEKYTRQGSLEELLTHSKDDQWREVFLLTSSLLEDGDADDFFLAFAATIQASVSNNVKIQKLLLWVENKVESTVNQGYKDYARRAAFFYQGIDLTFVNRAYDLGRGLTRDVTRNIAGIYALAGELGFDLELAFDLALDPVAVFDLSLAFDRGREHSRVRVLYKSLSDREKQNYQNSDLFEKLLLLKGQKDTINELEKLGNTFAERTGFITTLWSLSESDKAIMESLNLYRDREADTLLRQYLQVVILFNDCLDLAMVSNSDDLRNKVLQPAQP